LRKQCYTGNTSEIAVPSTLEAESTLTDRYQTTVPEPIRQVLRLAKRDKLHYALEDGKVVLPRVEARLEDDLRAPALSGPGRGPCPSGRSAPGQGSAGLELDAN
jgi:hypothetical protein